MKSLTHCSATCQSNPELNKNRIFGRDSRRFSNLNTKNRIANYSLTNQLTCSRSIGTPFIGVRWNFIRVTRYAENLGLRGCPPPNPWISTVLPFSFGLGAISAVEKSRLTEKSKMERSKREGEEKRRVDGFYPDGISSLPGRRIGIDRSPRSMHGNKSSASVGDPVSPMQIESPFNWRNIQIVRSSERAFKW